MRERFLVSLGMTIWEHYTKKNLTFEEREYYLDHMVIEIKRGWSTFIPDDSPTVKGTVKGSGEKVRIEVTAQVATCDNPCRVGSSIQINTARGRRCNAARSDGGMTTSQTLVEEMAPCGM